MKNSQKQMKVAKPRSINKIEKITKTIDLKDEIVFEDMCICECKVEGNGADRVEFQRIIFRNVDFQNLQISRVEFTDVRFENCNLSNANFTSSMIHRAEFIGCRMMGLNLSNSTLQDVYIHQCNGQFSLMPLIKIKHAVIEDSIFENSNFQDSILEKVEFIQCNLRLCQMSGTSLDGIDLSDSNVEGLGVRLEDIRGAIVSPMQAVDFSKLLGLVIKP